MKKEKTNSEKAVETETETAEKTSEAAKAAEPAVTKVGHLLKEMRLQKGLKLPDIAKKLCIRKFYLEAVEESRYDDLPPFPYGVGFIRSYADYLGLNSSNIVELYKEETNTSPDKNIFVLEPQAEATVPGKKYLIISLLGIIAVYAVWSFYNSREIEDNANNVPESVYQEVADDVNPEQLPLVVEDFSAGSATSEEPSVEENLPVIEVAPEISEANSQITVTDDSFDEPEAAVEEVVEPQTRSEEKTRSDENKNIDMSKGIFVRVLKETWIEVKDNDTLYISKVLQPGDIYKVPEGPGMIFSAGKPDGVEVLINGVVTPVVTAAKKTNIPLDKFINSGNL